MKYSFNIPPNPSKFPSLAPNEVNVDAEISILKWQLKLSSFYFPLFQYNFLYIPSQQLQTEIHPVCVRKFIPVQHKKWNFHNKSFERDKKLLDKTRGEKFDLILLSFPSFNLISRSLSLSQPLPCIIRWECSGLWFQLLQINLIGFCYEDESMKGWWWLNKFIIHIMFKYFYIEYMKMQSVSTLMIIVRKIFENGTCK